MDVGLGRGWLFRIANILCFLSSKSGLKGCVYGQVAGEVCGSLYALEEGGLPDPPLPLPLLGAVLGPQATLGLSSYALSLCTLLGHGPVHAWTWPQSSLGLGDLSFLPSLPHSTALGRPHGPGRGEPGAVPASAAV